MNDPSGMASTSQRNAWLVFSAIGDFAIAVLHLAIIAIGPKGYVYYGAVSLGLATQRGEVWPAVLMLAIALLFTVWGCYALAGARLLRPLYLLRTVLVFASAMYILRGLIVILDVLRLLAGAGYPLRQTFFSATALLLGLTHALGTASLGRRSAGPSTGDN